jgi:putative ABC transport system substrate-binding protein
VPTIGFLGNGTPSAWADWVTAFVKRLRELGWTEGRTVAIEYRWTEGHNERNDEFAGEFVRRQVDVIVTGGGAVVAVKRATSTIPIVFGLANDPVAGGLVASLVRPGGNVTGLSLQAPDLVGKRIEFLREVVPNLRRLAVMANIEYPAAIGELTEVRTAARGVGIDVIAVEIRRGEDIASGFEAIKGGADALYVCTDGVVYFERVRINTLALGARLPTMHSQREYVTAGGLLCYGPNVPEMFRRAGDFVDKILRGAKPNDIPIEQPTKFDFVINLTTARALGLTVPETLLARADEVIE